jgi:predicted nucleic acid-binding protein
LIVLADTNIVLDVVEKRVEFLRDSQKIIQLSADEEIDCVLSANAVTGVYYLVKRNFKDAKKALDAVVRFSKLIRFVDTTVQDIHQAMTSPMSDFEDAVIAAVAQREGADYIITRNTKDFAASPVSAVTPEEFLEKREEK